MPNLTVMVGLPASGKSTYLKFMDDPEFGDVAFVYSTDNYIERCAKMNRWTYNEAFNEFIGPATKHMNEMLTLAIMQGYDVYWDQTNMSSKKRIGILSRFPKSYHKICICRVLPRSNDEWEELNSRLRSREGKTIPAHVIEQMSDSYVEPNLDEGFDEVHLYDIYGNKINEYL